MPQSISPAGKILFLWEGVNNGALHISRPRRDPKTGKISPKEEAEYAGLVTKAGSSVIRFLRSGNAEKPMSEFVTDDPSLISYIRKNRKPGIREDHSMMPVRCYLCDFTVAGTNVHEQQRLAEHLAEMHPHGADDAGDPGEST